MEKMSLKAFWETVEQRLAESSAAELRAILQTMANQILPTERQAFIEKLKFPLASPDPSARQSSGDELLDEIDDFAQELETEMQDAEYVEEEHGWGEYGEENTVEPYADFVEPFTALLERAQHTFDSGDLILARDAFQKLFEVAEIQDDYGRGLSAEGLAIDLAEQSARYLRAVYETEAPADRPQSLIEQLRQVHKWFPSLRPKLNDLIQIAVKPLPEYEPFLAVWIPFLRGQSGKDADAWLREAIQLAHGTAGLEELARTEGVQRPRAYLDWFTALEKEERWQQVLNQAQAALTILPKTLPLRAAIAEHWATAAAKLGETEWLRAARWEAFAAQPTLTRLLDLWDVIPSLEDREAEMQRAARHVEDYLSKPAASPVVAVVEISWERDFLDHPASAHRSTLAHAYLLAGAWEQAYRLAATEKVLGWSSPESTQGLVLAAFLVLLSRQSMNDLFPNLAQLTTEVMQNSIGYFPGMTTQTGPEAIGTRLASAYAECFARAALSAAQRETFRMWCLDVMQRRVNAIVSAQHRKSYDKAALLVAACAEVVQVSSPSEANALVNDVRQQFPRHSAFQAELKTALHRSTPARR